MKPVGPRIDQATGMAGSKANTVSLGRILSLCSAVAPAFSCGGFILASLFSGWLPENSSLYIFSLGSPVTQAKVLKLVLSVPN